MSQELTAQVDAIVRHYVLPIGWKLLGAIAVWIVGGWAIKLVRTTFARFMRARRFDSTLARYLDGSANVILKVLMLIAVLGVLGIETTSFAALIAAAGIAIGAAWSGLLANFAAGLFLLTFRPFKVGDLISAAGVSGTVREIGLFVTAIDTPDQVLTFVATTGSSRQRAELQRESVSESRPDGSTARRRRSGSDDSGDAGEDTAGAQRPRKPAAEHRDSFTWRRRSRSHGEALLPQRRLLAGLLRYEPGNQPGLRLVEQATASRPAQDERRRGGFPR